MNDDQFDRLIAESLKQFADAEESDEEVHQFSRDFEQRMKPLLHRKEHHERRFRRKWFVLITVLLAAMTCSLTAYGSKTNRIHFFADSFPEYEALGEMYEDIPERMDLIYGLDALQEKYMQGVDISNNDQYTRFFLDEANGRFLEFSSYPKIMFRYHLNTDQSMPESMMIGEKEVIYYQDKSGMQYIIWSIDTFVFVVRSNFEKAELIEAVNSIEVYETPLQ